MTRIPAPTTAPPAIATPAVPACRDFEVAPGPVAGFRPSSLGRPPSQSVDLSPPRAVAIDGPEGPTSREGGRLGRDSADSRAFTDCEPSTLAATAATLGGPAAARRPPSGDRR